MWIPMGSARLPKQTSAGRAGLGTGDLGSRPDPMTLYVSDLDLKRPQRILGSAKHCRAWEGLAGRVSDSVLTPCPQCGSHMAHPGWMSVYTP